MSLICFLEWEVVLHENSKPLLHSKKVQQTSKLLQWVCWKRDCFEGR
jgi:hypothetical protein